MWRGNKHNCLELSVLLLEEHLSEISRANPISGAVEFGADIALEQIRCNITIDGRVRAGTRGGGSPEFPRPFVMYQGGSPGVSVLAQCGHRIDLRRLARRNVTGQQGRQHQHRRHSAKGDWIERADAIPHPSHEPPNPVRGNQEWHLQLRLEVLDYGRTMITPTIPNSSCSTHLYW